MCIFPLVVCNCEAQVGGNVISLDFKKYIAGWEARIMVHTHQTS